MNLNFFLILNFSFICYTKCYSYYNYDDFSEEFDDDHLKNYTEFSSARVIQNDHKIPDTSEIVKLADSENPDETLAYPFSYQCYNPKGMVIKFY